MKIKQIFDGDYGCEELQLGQKPKVSVTLVDDTVMRNMCQWKMTGLRRMD